MKKVMCFAMAIGLLVSLTFGCSFEMQTGEFKELSELFDLIKNADNTYSYRFTDFRGNVLFEKINATSEPKVEQLSPAVYGLTTQAGTGLSTNWAVYCDAENGRVSELFGYVLATAGEYVIYASADYDTGEHSIIVQDIFDKSAYYREYILENVSPVAADFTLDCKFDGEGNMMVSYYVGENYDEAEIIIDIP